MNNNIKRFHSEKKNTFETIVTKKKNLIKHLKIK